MVNTYNMRTGEQKEYPIFSNAKQFISVHNPTGILQVQRGKVSGKTVYIIKNEYAGDLAVWNS